MAVPNPFDQAGRYLAKLDPVSFLCWLLRLTVGQFLFRGWLDTRLLPYPGDPERTCDTVAHLADVARGNLPWAVVVEIQLQPDPDIFGRDLEYLGRLWVSKRPSDNPGDRFHVGAVVINLTGQGRASQQMLWSEARLETTLAIAERNLSQEDAGDTLARIAGGEVAPVVLPLIPLMHGGGEVATIGQWLALASAEPNDRRRADYGGLALVFAEAAGCYDVWKQALKGWNVVQSRQVLEWQAEALTRGRSLTLLDVLEAKFGILPGDLIAAIEAATDHASMKRWATLTVQAATLDEFRQKAGI